MAAIIQSYWSMLLGALGKTLLLTLLSLFFAMIIGMIFALMNVGRSRVCNCIGTIYVDAVRGVPLIVLAYFIYFGVPAGIESVDKGQMEASRSLGLSYGKSMRLVVIPQAIRTMIPSIINQFIITLKDTSILSVIGFPELTNMGKTISGNTFKSLQTWAIVGIMYMVIIITLSKIAKKIERRIKRGR